MSNFPLKPTHAPVKAYYAALAQFADGGHHAEGNTRSAFADLCRQSINPDLADPAIQNMLVQHLLTERIFRKVFNDNEYVRRNVIAADAPCVPIRYSTANWK